jgi:hypothetical protein
MLFWPAEEEQQGISSRIKAKHAYKNCVGIVDGTHVLLSNRPENCGEEYYTRKGQCVVSALIVVDNKKCIHHMTVGWPGSVHNNCIW